MLRKTICLFLLLIPVVWLPAARAADEATAKPEPAGSTPVMETVVVTADRVEESTRLVTANVTVIDEEAIKQSSARDLGDLLAEQGYAVRKYPGNLTTIEVRGFRTETHGNDLKGHVLILLDGRRAGTGNLAKILTRNVERVEIVNGPGSVQYGSGAMGGVINVITKKGAGRPTVYVEGGLGSNGYHEEAFGFSGDYAKVDFSGAFSHSYEGDYYTAKGDRFENTGYDGKDDVSLNLGYNITPEHRLGVTYTGFWVRHQGTPNYFSAVDRDDYSDKSNWSMGLVYDGQALDKKLSWQVKYYLGNDYDEWTDETGDDPGGYDDGVPSFMETNRWGAHGQFTLDLEHLLVTAGLEHMQYAINESWEPQDSTCRNTAGFVLAKAKLLDERLVFSAGLRYDDFEVRVTEPNDRTATDNHFSPSFGLAASPLPWLKLRANYAESFVMPAADEMAAKWSYFGGLYTYKGNPDLKPEKSRTWETGVDITHNWLSAGLTYFHTDYRDKIESTQLSTGEHSWTNLGDATIAGFEFSVSADIGAALDQPFSLRPYAKVTRLTEYQDHDADEKLMYTPDWTCAFGLSFNHPAYELSARFNVTYMGAQDVQDWESGLATAPIVSLDGYTVADLTVSKRIASLNDYGKLSLRGELKNIFNADYQTVKGYPMAGRQFFVGLQYQY